MEKRMISNMDFTLAILDKDTLEIVMPGVLNLTRTVTRFVIGDSGEIGIILGEKKKKKSQKICKEYIPVFGDKVANWGYNTEYVDSAIKIMAIFGKSYTIKTIEESGYPLILEADIGDNRSMQFYIAIAPRIHNE